MNVWLELQKTEARPRLVVATDLAPEGPDSVRLVRQSRGTGWLSWRGQVAAWESRGISRGEGVSVYGEWPWETCDDFVFRPWETSRSASDKRTSFSALTLLFSRIQEDADKLPDFGPCAVLSFVAGGSPGWLLLPAGLASVLGSLLPESEIRSWQAFRHPDLQGADSWMFLFASFALESALGRLPWATEDETLERQEIRHLGPREVANWLKDKDPATRNFVVEALTKRPRAGVRPPKALKDSLVVWNRWAVAEDSAVFFQAPTKPISDSETLLRERHRRLALFWRKRGSLLLGLDIGLFAAVVVVTGLVLQANQPHAEDSWTPDQVVRGYYRAWNDMEVETMSRLEKNGGTGVLKSDNDQTSTDFVLRQVRVAYEHRSPFEMPDAWIAAGRPVLKLGNFVRGDINLNVSQTGPSTWKAEYDQWISVPDDKPAKSPDEAPSLVLGSHVVDLLTLVKTSRGWKIERIERVRHPLP